MAFGLIVFSALLFEGCSTPFISSAGRDAPDRGFIHERRDRHPHVVAQTRPLGEEAGLRAGDRILPVNGREYETFRELLGLLDLTPGRENVYEIERQGERLRRSPFRCGRSASRSC